MIISQFSAVYQVKVTIDCQNIRMCVIAKYTLIVKADLFLKTRRQAIKKDLPPCALQCFHLKHETLGKCAVHSDQFD